MVMLYYEPFSLIGAPTFHWCGKRKGAYSSSLKKLCALPQKWHNFEYFLQVKNSTCDFCFSALTIAVQGPLLILKVIPQHWFIPLRRLSLQLKPIKLLSSYKWSNTYSTYVVKEKKIISM